MSRIINLKYLQYVRENLSCVACGKRPVDIHHVTKRGTGGGDVPNNIMPLCHKCHIWGWHGKGPGFMIEKFPGVKQWLVLHKRNDIFIRVDKVKNYLNRRH